MRSLAVLLLLAACGGSSTPPPTPPTSSDPAAPPPLAGECVASGCSGTVCTEAGKEMVTTCEFKAEYACYRAAACERQPDGACGWTQTADLTACLANPPPM